MSGPELPSDAVQIKEILASQGVHDYEPRVVNQLLDFVYRYSADILQDAEVYAEHAGNAPGAVELADVETAIELNAATSFVSAPGPDVLQELADTLNKIRPPAEDGDMGSDTDEEDMAAAAAAAEAAAAEAAAAEAAAAAAAAEAEAEGDEEEEEEAAGGAGAGAGGGSGAGGAAAEGEPAAASLARPPLARPLVLLLLVHPPVLWSPLPRLPSRRGSRSCAGGEAAEDVVMTEAEALPTGASDAPANPSAAATPTAQQLADGQNPPAVPPQPGAPPAASEGQPADGQSRGEAPQPPAAQPAATQHQPGMPPQPAGPPASIHPPQRRTARRSRGCRSLQRHRRAARACQAHRTRPRPRQLLRRLSRQMARRGRRQPASSRPGPRSPGNSRRAVSHRQRQQMGRVRQQMRPHPRRRRRRRQCEAQALARANPIAGAELTEP
eukprot:jgi/Tetstr1/427358/TSEL_017525.t1